MDEKKERTYPAPEVIRRLQQSLPAWRLEDGWIRRTYRTHGWKSTLMVINTIGHLAEAAFHHPDMTVSYAWVEVRLTDPFRQGHHRQGFRAGSQDRGSRHLATGRLGGALTGTPDDPRFAYIKYDR